ncbi:MAG TPA: PilZ domain-containing protein [Geothermobacteraceae bacterium]|nr:PilZ domain-containing protein [Geothermobacteraceae bacterium]
MKRLLLADNRDELLSTLEVVLKHWGYRVLALSRPVDILQSLEASHPGLLIFGEDLLQSSSEALNRALAHLLHDPASATILLKGHGPDALHPTETPRLDVPVDLFVLFEKVQACIESHPRRNLRLTVSLPGMVCLGERSNLAEVISVSRQGLFIKTTFQLGADDNLRVVLPLFGMKKELELQGKVIYRVEPNVLNNYRQGVGIEFTALAAEEQQILEDYLEKQLLEELTESQRGTDLDPRQLQLHSGSMVRIVKLP